jgi:hypothetical protein
MLSPEAKAIWKSKAGASLMGALAGLKDVTEEDRETLAKIKALSEPEPDPDDYDEDNQEESAA